MGFVSSAIRGIGVARHPASKEPATRPDRERSQLDETLEHSGYLLTYAAEAGIEVDPQDAERIIAARRGGDTLWDGPGTGGLLCAIAKLAAKVQPVTVDMLRCQKRVTAQVHRYTKRALLLVALLVPLSMISYITTGISNSIAADTKTANDIVVTLHTELDMNPAPLGAHNAAPPVSVAPSTALPALQLFATTIRSIKYQSGLLNLFILNKAGDLPGDRKAAYHQIDGYYELDSNLGVSPRALATATQQATAAYQKVRLHAKEVQDDVAVLYGAIASCILPVLYSLLGACAYLLRLLSEELNTKSFSPSYAISARFFIALIGGLIVGLFGNFMQGLSLPPLAIAFLVGYAADVFFSFLEGLLQNFRKAKTT